MQKISNRPVAPHVQAAIAGVAQPKPGSRRRQMAAHVQRAVASPLQAKMQPHAGANPHKSVIQPASFNVDTESRPSFRENVKEYFLNQFRAAPNPISGQLERWYRCASCGNWKQYEAIQLGHKLDWKAYAKRVGVTSRSELIDAYNDTANLQLECTLCNGSHDFERDASGGWKS